MKRILFVCVKKFESQSDGRGVCSYKRSCDCGETLNARVQRKAAAMKTAAKLRARFGEPEIVLIATRVTVRPQNLRKRFLLNQYAVKRLRCITTGRVEVGSRDGS